MLSLSHIFKNFIQQNVKSNTKIRHREAQIRKATFIIMKEKITV